MAGEASPSLPGRVCRINSLGNANPRFHSRRERFRQVDNTTEIRGHRQPRAAKLVYPANREESKATAPRLDPRYAPRLVSAMTAVVISLAVSLVETIVRLGFTPALVPDWLASFGIAVIVAVPTAVLVG